MLTTLKECCAAGHLAELGFGPSAALWPAVLVAAYKATLKKLRLVDRVDPITQMVANKIVELGQCGLRNADQLSALAISEMGL
jgi:hypothetical protein